jgi:uncharacterized membrane protein
MFNRLRSFIYGLGLGAGAMYLWDPERGNRRRALLRDQVIRSLNRTDDAIAKGSRDLSNRASGVIAEAKSIISQEPVSDDTLAERVRSKIGSAGLVSHPRAIQVTAHEGRITLSGPILAAEVQPLVARVASVRGVQGVDNQLEAHEQPGDVPALQGEPVQARLERNETYWTPATRLLAGLAGGMLTMAGLRRGGIMGAARTTAGVGLLARSITNRSLTHIVGIGSASGAVTIHKGVQVDAPVEEVFAFWQNFANFPRFMANIYEVRVLNEGRSHWSVAGPAGAPVEWDAQITNMVPNHMIAWESVPGSQVTQSGLVRFASAPDGGTHVNVRMAYTPPAGLLGHAVASFMGVNPRQAMDEDLLRFKSLIERGQVGTDSGTVTREDLRQNTPASASTNQKAEDVRGQAHRQVTQNKSAESSEQPAKSGTGEPAAAQADSGMPGGGKGRIDRVGHTGVYPASDPNAPPDAEAQGMASWGQGERGAAGYEDSGESEISGLGEETDFGSVIPGPEHD